MKLWAATLSIACLVLVSAHPAESKRPSNDITFGIEQTINVYPAKVETVEWAGVDSVLVQDLDENAIYQQFNARTSAYVPQEELLLPETRVEENIPLSQTTSDDVASTTDAVPAEHDSEMEVVPEAIEEASVDLTKEGVDSVGIVNEEEFENEPPPEQSNEVPVEQEPSPEPVTFGLPSIPALFALPLSTEVFQLVQFSTTTAIPEDVVEQIEEIVPVVESEEAEFFEDEAVADTVSGVLDVDNSSTDLIDTPADVIGETEPVSATTDVELSDTETHEITLSDFGTAPLDPGQLVTSMQLRLSFAAQLDKPASGTASYVEVLFSDSETTDSTGIIMLDDEVSNALNGGYFLFSLPTFRHVNQLKDMKITLRYHGDREDLDGMFLDAAWLELQTRTVTKDDLLKRGVAEELTTLAAPQIDTLVSDQVNFRRDENPIFNLRYNSQRNFMVRGFRSMMGEDLVVVDSVYIIHESLGRIDITPKVTPTKDGLLTIEIPEDALADMRPGTYQVVLVLNEGGKEFVDTFDFQWGILTTNPHKSEYEVGETARISFGALSTNGNTICDAYLDLYAIDPEGYVTKYEVTPSGQCNGNNVIDVPDYIAEIPVTTSGAYELYVERLDENGNILGFTSDTFNAVPAQTISIERSGPTRIYPPATYPMTLTVATDSSFSGTLTEYVPASFTVFDTDAEITLEGEWQKLVWDVSIMGAGTEVVSYSFDAPDISPYLFNLGPARIDTTEVQIQPLLEEVTIEQATRTEPVIETENATGTEQATVEAPATDSGSSTESVAFEEIQNTEVNTNVFIEHRRWQIASDATGNMLLLWDGATIPTGWTCVSCTGGDAFYQRFIVGSSTAGLNGGATTHTHTATATVAVTGSAGVADAGGGGADVATRLHTHTLTPSIGNASNLPLYRQLVVIQYNSAGEPTSIPTGAIAIFDSAVPTGWTRYSAQDGYYVRPESTTNRGVTAGSNTHTHTITGTLSGPTGTTNASGNATAVARNDHTHTISSNTASKSNEPPYIEVILGKLNATTTMPNDVIAMWTDTEPAGWDAVSSGSQPFENRFIKASTTYGTTGGASNHTEAIVTGIVTSGPSGTRNRLATGASDAPGGHTHTVSVGGFSNATHLPPYRTAIFAKRAGGTPPLAPTIYSLFDFEKTGTSTPSFEFTAEDTVGNDTLLYQFQWDDDADLDVSPLGDRSSDNETGCSPNCFINTVSGGDNSPFNDNERIRFTIQSALTNEITYFWRVRAKKSTGDTWSAWSDVRSLTYVVDTEPSQWLQNADEQFEQNTLFDAETTGFGGVKITQSVPTEALVVYGEGVGTTPRYRIWNGSAWGSEQSAQDVGGVIQWVRTKAATTRDEYVLGIHDGNNDVNVQVYDGVADTWGDLLEVTATANDTTRRAFDVSYETLSGDALVVYCSGTNAAYRVWNGTSWVGPTTITTASANNCNYIALASDPVSDEIIMVTRDTAGGSPDYEALVWNGSSWGNSTTLGDMNDTNNEGIAVEYEESGNQAIVAVSNAGGNNFLWTSWNGTEWSSSLTQGLGDNYQWGTLKADVGSDNMALCYIDTDDDIGIVRWNGESWATNQEFETTGNADTGRAVSCEFETTTGRDGYIMIPYSDDTNARYRSWNGTALSAESSVSTITDSWEVGTVRTGDGNILAYFHDDTNTQYDFSYWNGTAWSAAQTLETSTSVTAAPFRQPIGMSAQVFVPSEGVVTTAPISFSLVPNRPTWGELTWNTTEPNGTEVKIQVLYATTSSCNVLIPDAALSGNSTGFTLTDAPLNLSGLSTSTYSSICLRATLSSTNASTPTLDDWTVSWERQPYLVQSNYRWYVNVNGENPSDPWPSGAIDLVLNEAIPQDYSPGSGDILRLRMSARSDNAALVEDEKSFKLQYAQLAGTCEASTGWFDVGVVGSSTALWRGYNNLLAFDGSTISTLLLGSDVGGTYEEENDSDPNPNTIDAGDEAEWDWVVQQNGAADGVQYCFRMVEDSGVLFDQYDQYPTVLTNASPEAATLEKLFDNEQVASTTPWFEFVTEDTEGDTVSYQIQVDNDYSFASPVIDKNSIDDSLDFTNLVVPANKDPFTPGETIQYKVTSALTNGTTYYWRVRAIDSDGSSTWGDWSTVYSFTINTATGVTTWYQTEQEQFDTDTLVDTETTASDDVIITTGFTLGTTTGTSIDFNDKTTGNAWGELSWTNDITSSAITYRIEYLNSGTWELVPEAFLPGNIAGFTASPVSLLGLDPNIHTEIRVQAVLDDNGSTPHLQSWKIEWGYAVEQPTLIALFDNEKTGTTTPTFRFTTTDPDYDSLEYEITWSTDNTFTSSTTKNSSTSAGFINETSGGDTTPFNSGDTISFKIHTGDALTNGTTYWWRVRARDIDDGNVWSVWSPLRSFTVDTGVTVSTWFQTTDEQFTTDSLTDTEITGSDSVEITSIIREAFLAYAEGTVQTPRYRLWNGTTWTDEASAVSVGGTIRFVESDSAPTRDEYIVVTQESTGRVRAQVYDGAADTFDDLETIITAVPGLTARGYDVAYETTSGDALVVACDTTEATYKTWNGSSWSGSTAITLATTGNCNWVKLVSDPVSDEIMMVVRSAIAGATDYEALVWNGSSWGNSTTLGSMGETNDEGISVEYEESGDRAVVVVSNGGAASFAWNSWNGSAWSGASTQAVQDDFEGGRLVRDDGTDNMALCSIDNDGQVALVRWTGSSNSWNAYTTVELTGNSKVGRPFGCEYETTSGRDGYIMIPYSDTTNARYQSWNGSALSGEASISTIQDVTEARSARTGDGTILSIFYDDVNTQYDFSYWNGTAWSTQSTLEGTSITTTVPATIPLDIVARRYPAFTSGTVVSTPIDFNDGLGLRWQSISFSNTTLGSSSDILYQVEYRNGDTWALVPDSFLSGNSSGFSSSPIDISGLSRITHRYIRVKASLVCVAGNCPTLNDWTVEWSAGINVSGTIKQYNQTSSTTAGTVAVAVNGTLQSGKTSSISNGAWNIANVTAYEGDIVTVFVTGAADSAEAVGVTRYDGDGNITGLTLFERHLSLGSAEATTTPITNADIGLYDYTNTEDVFFNVTGTTLSMCAEAACADAELYVRSGAYYSPGGRIVTHDFENNGTFVAGAHTHEVNGSWDNNATTTMTGSAVVFAATSTSESVDSTGALAASFNNVTFGTTTGNGTWTLSSTLDVNGALTVSRGTLARGNTAITVAGNLLTATNGFWTGNGTTTFDGAAVATWNDQNATKQKVGQVVIDGAPKTVTLAGNVAAHSITIGGNDTLDATNANYDITVYGNWSNQNNFLARSGEVFFAATSSGQAITTTGDAFYDLSFTGVGGGWSFTESTLLVNNDFRVATGTVTLPTATTTIAGSFNATDGSFAHNNGVLYFTSASAETITFDGGLFTNVAYNLTFNGGGNWTVTDTSATSSNDVRVQQGTLNFSSGVFAIGGTLIDGGGSYVGGAGTVLFYSSAAEVLTAGGSSLNNVTFAGSGSWSFSDTNVDANGDLLVQQGTLTLPNGNFTLGGSYDNNATVSPGTGTLTFDSTDTGETVDFGASSLRNVIFNSTTGGWTLTAPATTTHNFTLTSVNTWTLNSGETLSVGGTFTNSANGASTTWDGSVLSLEAGNYSINTKAATGDDYGTLRVAANTDIKMWNSSSTVYAVASGASLYSQDHDANDGDLYIWGSYELASGAEYWSHATDFDGTSLGGGSRPVDVRFASGASASFSNAAFNVVGIAAASTTISSQGAGTYTVNVSGGTTTAEYYEFNDLGLSGLSLLDGVVVSALSDGYFEVGANNGAAITVSSSTIDANPAKQILNVTFATTTAISATNTHQIGGTPSSFWWFRNGFGNLYGEDFDNDTGDPGSVRFDDSSLIITIEGTVYSDAGSTPITSGTCNGSTPVVRVMVGGVIATTTSCSNVDGSYSASGVVVIGDPTITVYLNDASGGQKGSVITRTPTADILDMDIYANRVIVRNEDVDALTIDNLAVFDSSNDADLRFAAATSTGGDTLTVFAGNELFVFASSTFTPGGVVTLAANAAANSYDGTLYLAGDSTFNAYATSTVTIGGRLELATGATLNAASTTVLMNATTTGKSITAPSEITFHELVFNGAGGSWNLGADIQVDSDMTITAGTVTGTGDIYLTNGSLAGNGVLSLGAGTTTLAATNSLGGTSAWTFYNLELGDTIQAGTTTPLFTATTTVSGRLTINAAHYLDAGNTKWDLAGAGIVFTENGTFLEDTSTIRYSGAGASILSTQYYNLDLNAGAGSQTYTPTGGIIIDGDLTIGGSATTTLQLNSSDPLVDANGDVIIRQNGTLSASDTNTFTIAGSYDNNGTFTANGGTLTFDGSGTANIAAGASDFASVIINSTGDVTVTEHATATDSWLLSAADTFTLDTNQALAVGDTFFNAVGGAATTWSNSTLRLYGGNNYSINAATTSDSYGTLQVAGTTHIRMWNSDASTYSVASNGSLYSQDHGDDPGRLNIYGAYSRNSGSDFWSHATDFDGTTLGSPRKVDVYIATSSSVTYTGGNLSVIGAGSASTTIQALGTSAYGFTIGGNASTTWRYYELRDLNSSGLVFTGSPSVHDLSYGDFAISQDGGTAMTVGGGVITDNPALTSYHNRFALDGVGSGFNVTATGSALSSWRFENHYGGRDGEVYDVDPGSPPTGDPGYIVWDNSTSTYSISGHVYSDEGTTPLPACVGNSNAIISLYINGSLQNTVDCADDGLFTVTDISYSSNQSIFAYIDNGGSDVGAVVSVDLISDIYNFDIYEDRVIARHEAGDPLTISELAVWDSSNDADIPFTATTDLTLPSDTKLIVWNSKTFAPGGDVTLSGGGAGGAHDGTLELKANATWSGAGTDDLAIGGSFLSGAGATFNASNGTTTFTTSGVGRTVDVNEGAFNNVAFTGSGSWTITGPTMTTDGYFLQTAGALTFGGGTTTVSGSFVNSGGSFTINGSPLVLSGVASHKYTFGGSSVAALTFADGTYTSGDTNATATASVIIGDSAVTLPSGKFAIGGDFTNTAGTITHNTSELVFTNATSATLLASSSDLYAVTFSGGGAYDIADEDIALLDSLFLTSGSLTLASGTTAIGGSFDATGGTFDHATGTVLFNSTDVGEFIDPGISSFHNVQISAPSGGYTLSDSATTTNNFSLSSASSFSVQSGSVLTVGGVFLNAVGGNNTTWTGSTLKLDGENAYTINTKTTGGDQYDTFIVGANSDIRVWNSAATTTTVDSTASVYSQDNAGSNGSLYIYGDLHISTTTEYWSYATDFDGTSLTGVERVVTVRHASSATTTVDGGTLRIVGVSGNETTITNQGSGTYGMAVSGGTFTAQYYDYRNLNVTGLLLTGTPAITSLSYGDFELAVNGGSLITVSSTTLNANASKIITGNRFATTTAITGYNITLTGSTSNAWTFTSHTGNLDGEDFDVDGATECGSLRWNDSQCLLTQQTNYRWRNDDGGLGVPNSEWYNVNWDARKMIRIENIDTSAYTDAAVRLTVDHETEMSSTFSDLRFADSTGTNLIPYWIGSTTPGVTAEVWVKLSGLAAESTSVVYMYYDNTDATTTTSSSTATFLAADDFEDGTISEYDGETTDFSVDSTFSYDGVYGLEASNELGRTESGGIYDLDQAASQGETIRYRQYVDTSSGATDETCFLFGIQSSGAPDDNYAVCTDLNGTDRIVLAQDAVDSANSPAVVLDSENITYATGWYDIEIAWGFDDSIVITVSQDGSLIATLSATDADYTSGGIGFTYWYQHGGWDSVTVRPTLITEPTITFGAAQSAGGASWKSALNTAGSYSINDIARLRVAIENSGLAITDQQFLLEYAPLVASPSCEAVDPSNFIAVPVQSSCASSPVCMQSSSYVTNGAATMDLLTNVSGAYILGEAREDPSNTTGNIDIGQDEYTELEYVITPTEDVVGGDLCFRVTNAGDVFDTYLRVARMSLQYNPQLTDLVLNNGEDISLLPGTTTLVYATGTVTDLNTYIDIAHATTTFYRSGVTGGAACTPDNNDCYVASTETGTCSFVGCAGDSCTVSCYANIYFHADPTSTSTPHEGEIWYATVEVEDNSDGYDFGTAPGVELDALRAIDVEGLIDYGALAVNTNTGSYNASTSVLNLGNVAIDLEITGTDLSDGASSVIPAEKQKFATTTFTYGTCGLSVCKDLSSSTPVTLNVDLTKPTADTPPVEDAVFWGIAVPIGINSTAHQGINVFTPISP
ncbi:MAG: DUF2341 domain-containing protein [Candidatus Pacebacteria bacterium]|nr:DUF2341 domain-containing protein [Candidatus Paceibacterota bacterium]